MTADVGRGEADGRTLPVLAGRCAFRRRLRVSRAAVPRSPAV